MANQFAVDIDAVQKSVTAIDLFAAIAARADELMHAEGHPRARASRLSGSRINRRRAGR